MRAKCRHRYSWVVIRSLLIVCGLPLGAAEEGRNRAVLRRACYTVTQSMINSHGRLLSLNKVARFRFRSKRITEAMFVASKMSRYDGIQHARDQNRNCLVLCRHGATVILDCCQIHSDESLHGWVRLRSIDSCQSAAHLHICGVWVTVYDCLVDGAP